MDFKDIDSEFNKKPDKDKMKKRKNYQRNLVTILKKLLNLLMKI